MFVLKWKLYIPHTVIVTFFQSALLSLFNRPYSYIYKCKSRKNFTVQISSKHREK